MSRHLASGRQTTKRRTDARLVFAGTGCKEEKKRVSEYEYRVDLGEQSTFQKRRKSMEVSPIFHLSLVLCLVLILILILIS